VRDTTLVGGMETLFLFEGSQAMPASPSDMGEVLFKVIEVGGAALKRNLGRHWEGYIRPKFQCYR
jgi:hypothetical protein